MYVVGLQLFFTVFFCFFLVVLFMLFILFDAASGHRSIAEVEHVESLGMARTYLCYLFMLLYCFVLIVFSDLVYVVMFIISIHR